MTEENETCPKKPRDCSQPPALSASGLHVDMEAENVVFPITNGPLKVCMRWLIENFSWHAYMTELNEKTSFGPKFEDLDSQCQFQLILNWHSKEFKLKVRKHLPGAAYRCRIDISGVCKSVLDHRNLQYATENGLLFQWTPEKTNFARGTLEIKCEVSISAACSIVDEQVIPAEKRQIDSLEDTDIIQTNVNPNTQSSDDAVEFCEAHSLYIVEKMEKSTGGEDLTIYYDGGQFRTFRWIMCLFSSTCKDASHCASIKLEDVSYTSLCHVIHWVYTGEIDLEKVCLREVYSAATHLELEPLATLCFNTIMKSIHKDLIVDVLSSFKTSGQIISNKEILTHLKAYKAYVLESDRWSTFVMKKPRIALEILTYLLVESDGKVCSSPIPYINTFC